MKASYWTPLNEDVKVCPTHNEFDDLCGAGGHRESGLRFIEEED